MKPAGMHTTPSILDFTRYLIKRGSNKNRKFITQYAIHLKQSILLMLDIKHKNGRFNH
jgi:hypothetical protein